MSLNRRASESSPGDVMLHPVVIGAVVLLIANDHVLRGHWPDVLTGKLSDVAGLAFFPLLLQALVEVGRAVAGREHRPSQRVLAICIVMTGLVFAAGELSPLVDRAIEVVAGRLHWPLGGAGRPGVLTQDATDLIALSSLVLAWFVGHRRIQPTWVSRRNPMLASKDHREEASSPPARGRQAVHARQSLQLGIGGGLERELARAFGELAYQRGKRGSRTRGPLRRCGPRGSLPCRRSRRLPGPALRCVGRSGP